MLLEHKDGLCVTEVALLLKLPLMTVSRHILKLRKAGILKSYRKKQKMVYKITLAKLSPFK